MRINAGTISMIVVGVLLVILAVMWRNIQEEKSGKMVIATEREIEAYVDASMRVQRIREEIKAMPPGGTLEWLLLELRDAEAEVERYEKRERGE